MYKSPVPLNVYQRPLKVCCRQPITGFYRDGYCQTNPEDIGEHTACAEMTDEFLKFSKSHGNDLSTPRPEFAFAGLRAGDHWCLCASRWVEAYHAGVAPKLDLEATEESMLQHFSLDILEKFKL